ncbi:MAG TPA: aldehyde ferredoxin oxidoreductase C-terminal domain-containing protein, partial [Anaerolineae bacterium]
RNFREGEFEGHQLITGQTMSEQILIKKDTCYACAVRCKRVVQVKESAWGSVDPAYGGPEYETLAALGSNEGVSDLIALAKANELSAALGLDSISTGAVIAFAMEAFEKGLISQKDTDGLELRFGNAGAMLEMVEKIGRREGFGDLLAEGVMRAAEKIGGSDIALHVRGQEIPMHEPRLKAALGLGYAVSPTGADHEHNIHDTGFVKETEGLRWLQAYDGSAKPLPASDLSAEKVKLFRLESNRMHWLDTLVMCHFLPYSPQQLTDVTNAVTGWDMTPLDYLQVGERAMTLGRMFMIREGLDGASDSLPKRFFQKFASGPLTNVDYTEERFGAALVEYYAQSGWDASGRPTKEKLTELGIAWAGQG